MMQDNPFADLIPQTPQAPGVIYGRPKQPTALELNRDARADAAADRAAAAAERAAAADLRAASNTTRAIENDEQRLSREGIDAQAKLRGEFNALPGVKRFDGIRAAREQIRALVNQPNTTAQDDLAMIFSFMRALDPASVVREGEFATAQNAAGIDTRITNYYNRLVSGERLSPEQRRQFGQTADTLYKAEREQYNQRVMQYRDLAERQGIDPEVVARRYVPDQPAPTARGATPNSTEQQQRPQGAIEFGNTGGAPVGAEAYQQEIETGIRNGTITNADQVAAVAAKYRYVAPDRAETEKMFEALRNGARYGGAQAPVYASVQAAQEQMKRERGDSIADPFIRGVADTATLGLADEIAGIGNAIVTGGSVDENIALERARDNFDEQRNFLPRLGGQIAGGFALPVPASANTPLRLAGVGAGYGAGYGFGSADGGLADRLAGAAVGGAVGGGVGYAGGSLAQRLANRTPTPPTGGGENIGREVYEAAQRQGISPMAADVGGPMTRRVTSAAAQLPFSAGSVVRGGARVVDEARSARDRIAATVGDAIDPTVMGEEVAAAARGFAGRTSRRGGSLYDEAAALAGDTRVDPTQARAILQSQIARMEQVPGGGAGLEEAKKLLGNLEGNFTVQGIRDMRTEMFVAPELRGTPASTRLRQIVDAAADDVANSLEAAGRGEAAQAFRRADRYWRARIETIDQTIAPIVGNAANPKSGEQVVDALMNAGRSNGARLTRFVQSLPADEQSTLRATVISQLGKSSRGTQNAEGTAFSLNEFLTHWNTMTPRAKDILFRGEARDALNDLAKVAQGSKQASTYANRSNTGGAVGGLLTGGTLAIDAKTLGITAAAQFATGKLLASPRFVRWLAKAPRDPAQNGAWARRLGVIATREPALAPDIAPLQAALSQAPGRAAAQDERQ